MAARIRSDGSDRLDSEMTDSAAIALMKIQLPPGARYSASRAVIFFLEAGPFISSWF